MNHKKITWKCKNCGDVVVSDSREHHKMDFCKCGNIGIDLEIYQKRIATNNTDDLEILKEE